MSFPDLTPREHEVAAAECEAIAAYFDKLADSHDGVYGRPLAAQHSLDARTIRSRGLRHRERAQGLPRGALEFADEESAGE